MCNCNALERLIDISHIHAEFMSKLNQIEVGYWVTLMQCPECNQLYKVDAWDNYRHSYAVKLSSRENWEQFDNEALIKEKMVKNRGGLTNDSCMWAGCNIKQVKGSAFCVNHFYSGGTRD